MPKSKIRFEDDFPKDFKMKDKRGGEKWTKGRSPWNIIKPYKCLVFGNSGRGKTNIILNVLARADPPFKKVTVVHPDPEGTHDFDDIEDVVLTADIPELEDFDPDNSPEAVVIDDYPVDSMNKENRVKLINLFRYISSHKHVTVFLSVHDAFALPKIVRRNCNVFAIFKSRDKNSISSLASRLNMSPDEINGYLDSFDGHFDHLVVDDTINSPFKLRKNFHLPLE